MHITGKILVWMTLPIAAAGFIMAARLVDTRGKWMEQLQKVKVRNEKVAAELAVARTEREQARAELERESLRWDRYWSDVVGQYISRNNTLGANVGSAKRHCAQHDAVCISARQEQRSLLRGVVYRFPASTEPDRPQAGLPRSRGRRAELDRR